MSDPVIGKAGFRPYAHPQAGQTWPMEFHNMKICETISEQQQKCLHGEHEAQASEVRFGNFYGEQTVALICKYCRCLYVEKV